MHQEKMDMIKQRKEAIAAAEELKRQNEEREKRVK
jgi:hypothetical protein